MGNLQGYEKGPFPLAYKSSASPVCKFVKGHTYLGSQRPASVASGHELLAVFVNQTWSQDHQKQITQQTYGQNKQRHHERAVGTDGLQWLQACSQRPEASQHAHSRLGYGHSSKGAPRLGSRSPSPGEPLGAHYWGHRGQTAAVHSPAHTQGGRQLKYRTYNAVYRTERATSHLTQSILNLSNNCSNLTDGTWFNPFQHAIDCPFFHLKSQDSQFGWSILFEIVKMHKIQLLWIHAHFPQKNLYSRNICSSFYPRLIHPRPLLHYHKAKQD